MLKKNQLSLIITSLMYCATSQATPVLPTQGQVVHGQVNISQTHPSTLNVNQYTPKAIVNWETFNLSKDAIVQFQQPNSTSSILNRVMQGSSEIAGQIKANGQVYLLNPNGIIFSPTAQVNTAALIAATGHLTDEAYLSGQGDLVLSSNGVLKHSGQITAAQGGKIVLASQNINATAGSKIIAPEGEVDILAGQQVRLNVTADGLIQTELTQGGLNNKIIYQGDIKAKAGQVKVLARGDQSKIQHDGLIEAQSIVEKEGKIYLIAGYEGIGQQPKTGQLDLNGQLDASAPQSGNGGFIETSAAQLNISKDALVTTAAVAGKTGDWLLDPYDVYITRATNSANANFTAQQNDTIIHADILENGLKNNNITVSTGQGGSQAGDIWINSNLTWDTNKLTLNAARNINVNAIVQVNDTAVLDLNYGGKLKTQMSGDTFVGKINFDKNILPNQSALIINQNPYYLIRSIDDFYGLDTVFDQYKYIALAQDIDFNGSTLNPIFNTSLNFNGLGHEISNLILTANSQLGIGLFSNNPDGSYIGNLALQNIQTNFQGLDNYWSGSLVGVNEGLIDNVLSYVNMFDAMSFGGLVGHNDAAGVIENSYTSVGVYGQYDLLGGLVASNDGVIRNSYSRLVSPSVSQGEIGGIAAQNSSTGIIENTYSNLYVDILDPSNRLGALVSANDGVIRNSYATGQIWGSTVSLVKEARGLSQFENNYWLQPANNAIRLTGLGQEINANDSKKQSSYNWGNALMDGLGDSPWRIFDGGSQPLLRNFLKPVDIDVKYTPPVNLIQIDKEHYVVTGTKPYDGLISLPLEFSFLDANQQSVGFNQTASLASPNVGQQAINLSPTVNNQDLYSQTGYDLPNIKITSQFHVEGSTEGDTPCAINGLCNINPPIRITEGLTPILVSDQDYVALNECQMDDEDTSIPIDCILQNPDIVEAMPAADDDDTPAQPIQTKRALIIANANYQDQDIPSLVGVKNDQLAIRSVLEQEGYQVTVVEDAERSDMIAGLNKLVHESEQNDSVLVYYAGHGDVASGSSVGYWLPTDASLDTSKEWLSTLDVAKFLKNIGAKQVLLVSDSCFSGSLSYETALQQTKPLSENAILKRRSVMVMTSGSEEFVQDMAPNGLSPFANAFIDTIRQDHTAVVTGQSVYKQIYQQITSNYKQNPTYGALMTAGHIHGGEYLFKRN